MNCECSKCLRICEKTIDMAQDLIVKCGGTDTQECSKDVGEMMGYAQACLDACKKTIEHCHHFMITTEEKDVMYIAEECIVACKKTIDAIQQVLSICSAGEPECLDMCSRLIAACNNCAECCRKCIAMGI